MWLNKNRGEEQNLCRVYEWSFIKHYSCSSIISIHVSSLTRIFSGVDLSSGAKWECQWGNWWAQGLYTKTAFLLSDLARLLDRVEWAIGVPTASDLRCLGGRWTSRLPKKRRLYQGTAFKGRSGTHLESWAQLNFVDLHIMGATSSLLLTLVDAVLFLTVGAAWMSAASTVRRVLTQSEWKTCVGLSKSMWWPWLLLCLRTAPKMSWFPVTCSFILVAICLPVCPT